MNHFNNCNMITLDLPYPSNQTLSRATTEVVILFKTFQTVLDRTNPNYDWEFSIVDYSNYLSKDRTHNRTVDIKITDFKEVPEENNEKLSVFDAVVPLKINKTERFKVKVRAVSKVNPIPFID